MSAAFLKHSSKIVQIDTLHLSFLWISWANKWWLIVSGGISVTTGDVKYFYMLVSIFLSFVNYISIFLLFPIGVFNLFFFFLINKGYRPFYGHTCYRSYPHFSICNLILLGIFVVCSFKSLLFWEWWFQKSPYFTIELETVVGSWVQSTLKWFQRPTVTPQRSPHTLWRPCKLCCGALGTAASKLGRISQLRCTQPAAPN